MLLSYSWQQSFRLRFGRRWKPWKRESSIPHHSPSRRSEHIEDGFTMSDVSLYSPILCILLLEQPFQQPSMSCRDLDRVSSRFRNSLAGRWSADASVQCNVKASWLEATETDKPKGRVHSSPGRKTRATDSRPRQPAPKSFRIYSNRIYRII